ncbi:hypothetical protein FSP39_010007 [Pinctada imbricata]|uniref:SWIM-type domain-containing protein n=1 Tax=Pinctada imbricata TaxID=66713 RepID=A0AA88YI32_PINIB|nr:hypothetical protein FSP39_010007 [Pinctada imbricata]
MKKCSSIATSDLSSLPDLNFSFVESFLEKQSKSSGREQMNKGFKYYSEGYIHAIKLYPDESTDICTVKGKCYRSQKRNESPHEIEIVVHKDKTISSSNCSCTIGKCGHCGHVTAMLYQLAHYKQAEIKFIPTDVAKTSRPQTWHEPRGEKLHAAKVDNIVVQGYDRQNPQRATKGIKSTMYQPMSKGVDLNIDALLSKTQGMDILFGTVADKEQTTKTVTTKFGDYPRGSVLSYQQKLHNDFIINLMEENTFPDIPVCNQIGSNNFNYVMTLNQSKLLESLSVSESECHEIEKCTHLQSQDRKWHNIRKERVTASNAGNIAKRKKDGGPLAERLKSTRFRQTAAIKHGIETETVAAQEYSKTMGDNVNLYPCGVVVSPYCPWMAASPDRKVYAPERSQKYGLLEIKCPVTNDLSSCEYLHNVNGSLKLKQNHNYYYQVQMQMAVTGLPWCDFFVYIATDSHQETIYFDMDFWQAAKDKLDVFYFTHYLA